MEKIKLKPLVVLLENCLKDVSKNNDNSPENDCKEVMQGISSANCQLVEHTMQSTANTTAASSAICGNDARSIDPLGTSECTPEEDYVLSSDPIECSTQTLSLPKSWLLQLPISSIDIIDSAIIAKSSRGASNSSLCWEKLAEPLRSGIEKYPVAGESSSAGDVDLTSPSNKTSGTLLEGRSTPCKHTFAVGNFRCKKIQINITLFKPTFHQLQVLYKRNRASRTASRDNLRPKSSLKKFVPFVLQTTTTNGEHSRYGKFSKKASCNIFHSTPKPKRGLGAKNENSKKGKNKISSLRMDRKFRKKQLKKLRRQKEAFEKRQLKMKEAFEKKQLRLAFKQKKEAFKYRNKFENALGSINNRICNQNGLWRMLSN